MGISAGHLISMEGAFDIHFHSAPCIFPRIATDYEVARSANDLGFGGLLLKCHHENTVSRAIAVQREYPDMRIFGGIVLNWPVGGINPDAVEACLQLGGKAVWLPTMDSTHHEKIHGSTGKYDIQTSQALKQPKEGIQIIKENRMVKELELILDIVAGYNVMLGTSHQSPEDLAVIVSEAKKRGVRKISITHPFYKTPGLTLNQLEELVSMGGLAEFGYCTVSPMWASATIRQVAEAINKIGPENCVLMSDCGQRHNPIPPEGLRVFAQGLFELGIQEEHIDIMIKRNPRRLLGIEAW